jgi:hypothetical protein
MGAHETHGARDALHTPLCDRLGIRYPIFGFSHSMEVTAAITNAGGFGVYGATRDMPDAISARLAEIRSRVGDRPFGADLLLPMGMADKNDWVAAEARIPEVHKAFVRHLKQKYKVPDPTGKSFFSSVVRSNELFEAQVDAVLRSDVNCSRVPLARPGTSSSGPGNRQDYALSRGRAQARQVREGGECRPARGAGVRCGRSYRSHRNDVAGAADR